MSKAVSVDQVPPKPARVRISLSVPSFGHYLARHLSLHLQPTPNYTKIEQLRSFSYARSFYHSQHTHLLILFIYLYSYFVVLLVANKWLHIRGQEFRRKCSLDRNA